MLFHSKDQENIQIHYEIIENVVTQNILFIHGNLSSNNWWYPLAEVFKAETKFSTTSPKKGSMILVEFLGCGKSSIPQKDTDVNMQRFAEYFISLVKSLPKSLTEKLNLVGHSTGGTIVTLMLAKEPQLFNKAVLLDSVGAQGVKFESSMTDAFEMMKKDKEIVRQVLGSTVHQIDLNSSFFNSVLVEDAFHAVNSVGPWVLKALDGMNIEKEIESIPHPVLVLHGEKDLLLPQKESEKLARLLKNGTYQTILNHGHCTNVENPILLASLLKNFLN